MLWLLPILARRGLSDTIAKPLAWLANIAIVAALLFGGIWYVRHIVLVHDASIATEAVSIHDKDLTIEASERVINATEAADTNQAARDDVAATNDKELGHEAAKGNASAVGPGTAAVLQRMRDQQAAGRR